MTETTATEKQRVKGIQGYLQNAEETGNPIKPLTQEEASKRNRQQAKEQYVQINWDEYKSVVGGENAPLRFFVNKNNPKDTLVRIMYPGSEYPVVVRIPEAKTNPDLEAMTQYWFEIETKVMLDETTLWLLGEIASRYNRRQPLILEGMPAVSKTFVTWVFACIVGQPYDRLSFSAGSKEQHIQGSRTPDVKIKVRTDLERLLDSKAVTKKIQRIEYKDEEKRTPVETDILLYHETLRELLKNPEVNEEEIYFTCELLQSVLNVKLLVESQYAWQDTNAVKILEGGGILALDEINTVEDIAVTEVLLPALEVNNQTIPMPKARGKHVTRHPDAMIIIAQNPISVAGRNALTDAFESRCEKVIVPNITEEYISNVLTFFMTGNDPTSRINGRLIKGRENVPTSQRKHLEFMPKRDLVIQAISTIHVKIAEMVTKQVIGRNKRDGGSYVFDQRDIAAILDAMQATIEREFVKDTATGLEPVDIDWIHVVKKSLKQVYVSCLPGDETTGDYQRVNDFIENQPIWNMMKTVNTAPTATGTATASFSSAGTPLAEDANAGGIVPDWGK